MKICHVTKKYPRLLGGDAVVVSALRQQQKAAGHTVIVVTSRCSKITHRRGIYQVGLSDTSEGLDAITGKRIVSLLMLFFASFWLFFKERPHVIHSHSIDMAWVVSLAARFLHIPIVHTFHIVTAYDGQQSKLRRMLEPRLTRWARPALITVPNQTDATMLQKAVAAQVSVVPNGIDLAFWQQKPHAPRQTRCTFISVGRLEPQKGYKHFIHAAALLKRLGHQAFSIVIIGEGSQKSELELLIQQLQLTDTVRLVGHKSATQTRRLLAAADIAVCTSLYETTPLTLLEAWAVGLPVIMTPVGLLRDAPHLRHAVLLTPAQDEQALMQTMLRAMQQPAHRAVVAAAGHQQVKHYAWPGIAASLERLYGSVV